MFVYFAVVGTLVAFVAAFIGLFKVLFGGGHPAYDKTWLDEFSIEKYRPMLRLLSERDFDFLALQTGFTPEIARSLRIERRKIFRAYLRCLVRDFNRLHAAAREALAHSAEDRSALTATLLTYQMRFYAGVVGAYCRLGLHTLGIGTVDVRGLLSCLEAYRMQIAPLAVAPNFA